MDFETYIATIAKSRPSDWNRIEGGWLHRFALANILDVKDKNVEVEPYDEVLAFRPNLAISVSEGLVCRDEFNEEWAAQFAKPYSIYVDFFYNGMMVFRTVAVRVDESRGLLPLPSPDSKGVPRRYHDVIRALYSTDQQHQERFDEYFEKAGLKVVDEPWP